MMSLQLFVGVEVWQHDFFRVGSSWGIQTESIPGRSVWPVNGHLLRSSLNKGFSLSKDASRCNICCGLNVSMHPQIHVLKPEWILIRIVKMEACGWELVPAWLWDCLSAAWSLEDPHHHLAIMDPWLSTFIHQILWKSNKFLLFLSLQEYDILL